MCVCIYTCAMLEDGNLLGFNFGHLLMSVPKYLHYLSSTNHQPSTKYNISYNNWVKYNKNNNKQQQKKYVFRKWNERWNGLEVIKYFKCGNMVGIVIS